MTRLEVLSCFAELGSREEQTLTKESDLLLALKPFFAQPTKTPEMSWKLRPKTGHLSGVVYEEGRAHVLDGAKITMVGPVTETVTSDATGHYGFVDLPPGDYKVIFSGDGFSNRTNTIAILLGKVELENAELNFISDKSR